MTMTVRKTDEAVPLERTTSAVLPLPIKQTPAIKRLTSRFRQFGERAIPPVVVIGLVLLIWELACRRAGSALPPPSSVLSDTWELIIDPFFDRGGIDRGLFWHLSASLQRVALGYALASIAGVALGTLVGQSVWAMRGLDPIFRCCGRCRRLLGCRCHWPAFATGSLPRFS